MGCPMHIWGPAAAALLPVARLMRFRLYDRFAAWKALRASDDGDSTGLEPHLGTTGDVPLRRFAPIDPHSPNG